MAEQVCGTCGSVPTEENDENEWYFFQSDERGYEWLCLDCQIAEIPDIEFTRNGKTTTIPFRYRKVRY